MAAVRSPLVVSCMSILLLIGLQHNSLIMAEDDSAVLARWMRDANFPFSLSRPSDVKRLRLVCDISVLEATLVLEKFGRGEYTKDDDEPKQAVAVLTTCGGVDRRSLTALCNNILTLKSDRGDESAPLVDFVAARALVAIGGRGARGAVFESLRQPMSVRELLIRTHVLAQMEPRSVMLEFVRLALEDEEHRETIGAAKANENLQGQPAPDRFLVARSAFPGERAELAMTVGGAAARGA